MKSINLSLKTVLLIVSLTIIEFNWPNINTWLAPIAVTLLALDFKRKNQLHWLFIITLIITVFPELQITVLGPLQIHHVFLLLIALLIIPDWLSQKTKIPKSNQLVLIFSVVAVGLTLINFKHIVSWHRLLIMGYMFLITLLTPLVIKKMAQARQLFASLWATGIAVGALALAALYTAIITDTYFTNPYLHISTTEGVPRLAGTLLDSNFLGHFLLLILPLGFAFILFRKKEQKLSLNFLFVSGLVFLEAIFFLTYSRSAYLGLAGALITVLIIFSHQKTWLTNLAKITGLTLAGFILASLLYPSFIFFSVYRVPDKILPLTVKNKIIGSFDPARLVEDYRHKLDNDPSLTQEQRDKLLARDVSSDSLGYRLSFWRAGLAMFKDHPWTGVGVGQFRYNYANYGTSNYLQFPDAHNIYIETLAELGLPGLTLLLITLLAAIMSLIKMIERAKKQDRLIGGGVLAALIGIMLQSLLVGGLGVINIYLLLGLAAGLPVIIKSSPRAS